VRELSVHGYNSWKTLRTEHILAKPMRKLKHSYLKTADVIVPINTILDGCGV